MLRKPFIMKARWESLKNPGSGPAAWKQKATQPIIIEHVRDMLHEIKYSKATRLPAEKRRVMLNLTGASATQTPRRWIKCVETTPSQYAQRGCFGVNTDEGNKELYLVNSNTYIKYTLLYLAAKRKSIVDFWNYFFHYWHNITSTIICVMLHLIYWYTIF